MAAALSVQSGNLEFLDVVSNERFLLTSFSIKDAVKDFWHVLVEFVLLETFRNRIFAVFLTNKRVVFRHEITVERLLFEQSPYFR